MKDFEPLKGYEGLYEINRNGVVNTLGNFPNLRNRIIGPLKSGLSKGYRNVCLTSHERKRTQHLVHRLVAIQFLPNPHQLRCVNHKDENKENNVVDNLEWCTDQYNKEYSARSEYSFKHTSGLTVTTKNLSRFCRENNISQGNLSKVVAGQRNHHKGWSLV